MTGGLAEGECRELDSVSGLISCSQTGAPHHGFGVHLVLHLRFPTGPLVAD